jgi:hypothetical protein
VAQNEVEFLFKARDEVSKVLATISSQIERTTTGVGDGARAAGVGLRQLSRENSSLTQFVREQRAEQRMQGFLFRETSQAVGALAFGLTSINAITGSTTGNMRQLNNALNAGFTAFQGINFILARLPGPISLAVAGLGAISAIFMSIKNSGSEADKKIQDIEESIINLSVAIGKATKEQLINFLTNQLIAAQKEVNKLNDDAGGFITTIGGVSIGWKASAGEIEAIRVAQEKVLTIEKKIKEVTDEDKKDKEKQAKADSERLTALTEQARQLELQRITAERIVSIQPAGPVDLFNPNPKAGLAEKRSVSELDVQFNTILDRIAKNFDDLGSLSIQVGDVITNTMTNAAEIMAGVFTGAITRIDEAFKALIQSMIAELIKIGLLKLFAGIVSGGGSVVGDVVGSSFGKTVAKPVAAEVGGSTVNIYVTPEARSVSVADRRRAMAVIEKAMYTEK